MTNTAIFRASTYRISRRVLVAMMTGARWRWPPFIRAPWAPPAGRKTPKAAGVALHGAGSTFAAPLYKKWIEEYAVAHPGVSIAYDLVGAARA